MVTVHKGIRKSIGIQGLEEILSASLVVVQLECQGTTLLFTQFIPGHNIIIDGSAMIGVTPAVGGYEVIGTA